MDPNAKRRALGRDKAVGNNIEVADKLDEWANNPEGCRDLADAVALLHRAAHLLRSAHGDSSTEERFAWDRYVAALAGIAIGIDETIILADILIEERRKRFGRAGAKGGS